MWQLASRPNARVEVLSAGLACCSLEVEAAAATGLLVRAPQDFVDRGPCVLVVAGTITAALEPAVVRLHEELAQRGPVRVISFGACATSGGPYWDAPTVVNGLVNGLVDEWNGIAVESYIPGCPPRPEALVAELERLVDSMNQGVDA
jgi:NADH-quinone oxidoreductase subunit B